ncbi:P-loop containing nucleoside triphosphate hydrolase protein [Thamnocephalis sphaerospora]|uniref:Replication factor C subunit 5 n=1 Tax=Thamnocephalis sphaerospora TaxID=78915 RepID=A0A4P9XXJ4_9FUNG|nr:P-loop containing nucleoside triphosphate hydrolase protein [Thamnocephalis sphaerospora]|eukprot:RKP11115.1 P-loop containing nucleoside triphosphate hydrolase protein [Thamnocephalis sphaerospora]
MSLWVDKYRPTELSTLTCHQALTGQLKQLANSSDLPHLLFYGPSGAGKKTRILAVLRELFGSGVEKIKLDTRNFTTPSNRAISISVVSSLYHLEVTPSDIGFYDRIVIQDLIKEVAQAPQLDLNARQRFKVVVIHEADTLTRDAQTALRRTMERYTANLRIILCCNTTSRIISPIRSRCLLVRVAAPSVEEIEHVLQDVASKESFALPAPVAKRIIDQSDSNLRRALLMLDGHPPTEGQQVPAADWQEYIQEVAASIVQEQSPQRLLQVRTKFYELLSHCIPAETILKTLAFELMKNVDDQLKPDIAEQAAFFDHRLRCGQKAIFHLEAFTAKFMSIYKRYLISLYG